MNSSGLRTEPWCTPILTLKALLSLPLVIVTKEHEIGTLDRGSDGIISLTFVDLEWSEQGYLPENTVSFRESAIVTEEQ